MTLPVVLDSDGLSALCESRPPAAIRALLREAWQRGRDVVVPAVVCAEVCRGVGRTRRVETVVTRQGRGSDPQRPVDVVATDFDLARQVGAVLHGAGADSRNLADAHVVAVCVRHGGGLVITSDPDDIHRLAAAVPSARVVTRPPT